MKVMLANMICFAFLFYSFEGCHKPTLTKNRLKNRIGSSDFKTILSLTI